jgi:hypothetical protein
MKITDIPQTTELMLQLTIDGLPHTCSTTVLTAYGDGLLVSTVMHNGKAVGFCSGGTFEFTRPCTHEIHRFHVESVSRIELGSTHFHLLRGQDTAVTGQQRKAERYMVQRMGTAVINYTRTINVIVNDISMRGISLLVGQEQKCKVGDEIRLSFFTSGVARRLTLQCKVVRLFNVQGYNAVGCIVKNVDMDYLNFVNEKKAEHNKKISAQKVV